MIGANDKQEFQNNGGAAEYNGIYNDEDLAFNDCSLNWIASRHISA